MASDWQRLADAVVRRRGALGLTQVQVAQRGPLSLDRVQAIEGMRSTKYRAGTIAALERALEWDYGSVATILAGGDPTPSTTEDRRPPPPTEPTDDQLDQMIAEARRDRARGDAALYELLMSIWRLRHARPRDVPEDSDKTTDIA